ncbi:MAG: TonB-dependent receptor [Gammaproteobacteria bacterium]|nr:TonB-dependent receptor [Gammaproteobacteria bacterium]
MNYSALACTAIFTAANALPVLCQENLKEIIVTTNRIEQSSGALMAATTVITRQEIETSLAQNLNELLLGKAGVQMTQSGGQGSQTSLFLRGTESDHTLILIDGVQITTATGAAGRLEFVPLDQIERIEIVRGPRSSIYGSEAIGGVLQIFTRTAGENAFDASINLAAGTQNMINSNLNLSGRFEDTSIAFNYSGRETDGIDSKVGGNQDDDGFNNDSLALSVSHHFGENTTLTVNYSEFNSESEYDDGIVEGDSEQFSATLELPLNDRWVTSLTIDSFTADNLDIGAFGTTSSETATRSVRWINTLSISTGNTFSFGFDAKEQQLDYSSFGALQSDNSRKNRGVYGVYLHSAKAYDITLSLRNDDDEQFGRYSTGSIALGRKLNETSRLWASYGTAYKAPNLIDLYVDFPSFFFFANPDLGPETSENLEIGLELFALNTVWNFNLFHNVIEDLIGSNATFSSLDNIDKVEIDGLEITASRELAGWGFDMALTLLDHENKSTSDKLLRRPEGTFSLQASRQFDAFDVAIDWLMQASHKDLDPVTFGPSDVGGYGIINVVAGYRFSESINVRLKIGNLFDKDYSVVDGFNTYGRTAQLSFNYKL